MSIIISRRMRNKVMHFIIDIYRDNSIQKYNDMINLRNVSVKLKMDYNKLLQIIEVLEAQNYLTHTETVSKNNNPESRQDFVVLKPLGIAYFETRSDQKWEFIRKSILTPILISILTTAVIYLSRNLLLQLLEWIQIYLCP